MLVHLRGVLKNFLELLTLTGTTIAEFNSSTAFILFGLFLASPWGRLDASVPYPAELLSIMPESGWAATFLFIGIAQAIANVLRFSAARTLMAFVSTVAYSYLSLLGVLVKPASIVAPLFAGMALVQGICFLVMSRARYRLTVKPLTDTASLDRRYGGARHG